MIKIFLIFLFIFKVNSAYFDDKPHLEYMKNDFAKNYYHPFYNQTISFVEKLTQINQLNQQCRTGLARLIAGVLDNEFWALKCKYFKMILNFKKKRSIIIDLKFSRVRV